MTYSDLLINTCTVKRYVLDGGADAYGNPTGSWDDHLTDIPCRQATPSGREIKVGAEVVQADYEEFLGDVDITEQDRIEIGTTSLEVLLVKDRQDSAGSHHKECSVRTVR